RYSVSLGTIILIILIIILLGGFSGLGGGPFYGTGYYGGGGLGVVIVLLLILVVLGRGCLAPRGRVAGEGLRVRLVPGPAPVAMGHAPCAYAVSERAAEGKSASADRQANRRRQRQDAEGLLLPDHAAARPQFRSRVSTAADAQGDACTRRFLRQVHDRYERRISPQLVCRRQACRRQPRLR